MIVGPSVGSKNVDDVGAGDRVAGEIGQQRDAHRSGSRRGRSATRADRGLLILLRIGPAKLRDERAEVERDVAEDDLRRRRSAKPFVRIPRQRRSRRGSSSRSTAGSCAKSGAERAEVDDRVGAEVGAAVDRRLSKICAEAAAEQVAQRQLARVPRLVGRLDVDVPPKRTELISIVCGVDRVVSGSGAPSHGT